jgi:hypothetical protein
MRVLPGGAGFNPNWEKSMKKKLTKGFGFLAIGIVALFAIRVAIGYVYPSYGSDLGLATRDGSLQRFDFSGKNYATEKFKVAAMIGNAPAYDVDQKYEKVASLATQSRDFDQDNRKIRDLTAKYDALVQFEQRSGLPGSRRINLAIGVPPPQFDSLLSEVEKVGKLSSIGIDKVDQTSEFRDLTAQHDSLQKSHDALVALKSRAASLGDSITLENRILEIETQIQDLGVKLGQYGSDNQFCTVKLSMQEEPAPTAISIAHRLRVALRWTAQASFLAAGFLCLATLFLLLAVVLVDRLKLLPGANRPTTAT